MIFGGCPLKLGSISKAHLNSQLCLEVSIYIHNEYNQQLSILVARIFIGEKSHGHFPILALMFFDNPTLDRAVFLF